MRKRGFHILLGLIIFSVDVVEAQAAVVEPEQAHLAHTTQISQNTVAAPAIGKQETLHQRGGVMFVHVDIMSFEPPLAVVTLVFDFFRHLVPTTNDAFVWSSRVNNISSSSDR